MASSRRRLELKVAGVGETENVFPNRVKEGVPFDDTGGEVTKKFHPARLRR